MQRRTAFHAAGLLALATFTACITPVAVVDGNLYVGAYRVASEDPHPQVRYEELQGVGFGLGPRRFGFGYQHLRIARIDPRHAGFHAVTPIATVWVGKAAVDGARADVLTTHSSPVHPGAKP